MNRFLLAFSLGTCALATSLLPSSAHAATRRLSVSVSDARLVEPPSGQKSMIFQVSLSGPWPSNVDVYYSTADGPSSAASDARAAQYFDYTPTQGTITILPGTTKAQIVVPILSDNEVEKNETFLMTLNDLAYADDPNSSDSSIVLNRSTAVGTIVEPTPGVTLGGQFINYTVSPTLTFDPKTGAGADKFDTRAVATPLGGMPISITGANSAVTATTDATGKYSVMVRPGTYTIQPQAFSTQDDAGNTQAYTLPARTVTVSTPSQGNNFYFYGVAGTVGVPAASGSGTDGVVVQVEARPVGAKANSAPVSTAIAQYTDNVRVPRGYRFFLPALSEGKYVLTVKDTDPNNFTTFYYSFPAVTVTLPDTVTSNRPDAHVEIKGTLKFSNRVPVKSSSGSGS